MVSIALFNIVYQIYLFPVFFFIVLNLRAPVLKGKLKLSVSRLYGLDFCLYLASPLLGPAGLGA